MGAGGYRRGRPHVSVESCHTFSPWGTFQSAQVGEDDDAFAGEWIFGDDCVTLEWTRDGQRWSQIVRLTWSPCRYGGRRTWLICPQCGRRAGKLYLPTVIYRNGGRVNRFACRHCYHLTYEQRQSRDQSETMLHRAERFAERWLITSKDGESFLKPKGMHEKTFQRKVDEYNALVQRTYPFAFGSVARDMPQQADDVDSAKGRDLSLGEIPDEELRRMTRDAEQALREWLIGQRRDLEKLFIESPRHGGPDHFSGEANNG
jgi:hypothetical protein